MPGQLIDERTDLLAVARELDRGAGRSAVQQPCPFFEQLGEVRRGNPRDDQLAAVDVVVGEVFDLDHLDQPLQLLAHLVGFGVAVVDLQRQPQTARLRARSDRDGAHVKTPPADDPGNLGQRVGSVLDQDRENANLVFHLPTPWGGRLHLRTPWGGRLHLPTLWGGRLHLRTPWGGRLHLPTLWGGRPRRRRGRVGGSNWQITHDSGASQKSLRLFPNG